MATVTTNGILALRVFKATVSTPPAVSSKSKLGVIREKIPWWRSDVTGTLNGQAFWNLNRSGVLSGSVETDGTLTPYADVYLYYMANGTLLEKTRCDSGGYFSFKGLGNDRREYTVVAYIPPLQALIFDQLLPV